MLPVFRERIRRAENERHARRLRHTRLSLRGQSDPFSLPEARFIELYRFNKRLVRSLIHMLTPFIPPRHSLKGISLEMQVFTALRFYATGSYQRVVGLEFSSALSQTSVNRCIHNITNALAEIAERLKSLSLNQEERNIIKAECMQRWVFPGVVGMVDGFHVTILKPVENEQNYINRKGYHSINIQMVCDHQQKIRNIFANFGGSTHDSLIWKMSEAQQFIRRLHVKGERCWFLGDSGYPLQPYLLTPFRIPENVAEQRFNSAHIRTRNVVERTIGLLKMRFRCLLKERSARYSSQFVCQLVKVCALLHNMCVENNIPFQYEYNADHDENNRQVLAQQNQILDQNGINMRNFVVNRYFL